jgi:DNA polymerase (family 10)
MSVSAKGDTKASVVLAGGLQADLRVVSDREFPFALLYFTGSKEHNIVMRQRAIQRGLRLNEYGLFHSDVETRDPKLLVPCCSEEEIFQQLGLACIPPELREDAGEFAAAEKKEIPRLLEWTQLKGSLHNHSTWSDGHGSAGRKSRRLHGGVGPAPTGPSPTIPSLPSRPTGWMPERVRQQVRAIKQP